LHILYIFLKSKPVNLLSPIFPQKKPTVKLASRKFLLTYIPFLLPFSLAEKTKLKAKDLFATNNNLLNMLIPAYAGINILPKNNNIK